jgi:hypothetical protein
MKSLCFAASTCGLLLAASSTFAQDSAAVKIQLKISPRTPSFSDQRLVVTLYHDVPGQEDRGSRTVDRYVNATFSHQTGQETVVTITLGDRAKLNRDVQYTVNATVFTPQSQPTLVGDLNGQGGPFMVLTNGAPNKLTLQLNPAR